MDKEKDGKVEGASKKIFISYEDEEEIIYTAHPICDCDECRQDLDLVIDKSIGKLELRVYAHFSDFDQDGCKSDGFFSKLAFRAWKRLSVAGKMLLTGAISADHWFMFQDEQSIADYIKALQAGLAKIKKYNEERRNAPST